MANQLLLDRAFAACAHPIRRGIIERLADREMTVGDATRDFHVSKPAISRHLRVLEDAGAIVRVVDGRTHRLRLSENALADAREWMATAGAAATELAKGCPTLTLGGSVDVYETHEVM